MIDADLIQQRLSVLYRRCRRLEAARIANTGPSLIIHASPHTWGGSLRSRLEGVTDDLSGTRYAVWIIGETLAAIGGYDLMHSVFTAFEQQHGAKGAAWLDHRWSGVGGAIWVA